MVVGKRQLHAIEAPFATAPRCVAERAHEHRDVLLLHLVRHLAMDLLRDLRRRQQHVHSLDVRLSPPSEVRELAHDTAVMPMDRVGDGAIGRHDRVVVIRDHVPGRGGRRGMDAGGAADDRERGATARLRLVVRGEARPRLPALGHRLRVRGRDDSVLQREPADTERREEVPELVRHAHSMPASTA